MRSQSPEGSTADFHEKDYVLDQRKLYCLNPPKGPRPISTAHLRMLIEQTRKKSQSPEGATADFHLKPKPCRPIDQDCLNPPKGPRPISTLLLEVVRF